MKTIKMTVLLLATFLVTKQASAYQLQSDSTNESLIQPNRMSIGYDWSNLNFRPNTSGDKKFGVLVFRYEHFVNKKWVLGGAFNVYKSNIYDTDNIYTTENDNTLDYRTIQSGFQVMAKANYYLDLSSSNQIKKYPIDVYFSGGLGLSYQKESIDYHIQYQPTAADLDNFADVTNHYWYLAGELKVGAKWFLLDDLGLYGEFGYGLARMDVGLTYKW